MGSAGLLISVGDNPVSLAALFQVCGVPSFLVLLAKNRLEKVEGEYVLRRRLGSGLSLLKELLRGLNLLSVSS